MSLRQAALLAIFLLAFGGVSAWLQFGVVARAEFAAPAGGEIDYYIQNFSSAGADARGKKYRVSAERLDHYARTGRARLLRPHIVEYAPDGAAQHTRADSGWLSRGGGEVELSGNVRMTREPGAPASATGAQTRIRLKGGE